jgi:DHA2 family methylenomycin A resistance protein-like MFS transporter
MKNDSITPIQMMTIILPAFMMGLDFLVMSITLQPMSVSLGLSPGSLQWLLTGYAIGTASFYAPGGKLTDIIGCRRAFLTGVILFTLSSTLISFSKNLLPLAILRILQGAGGSISVCGSLALISQILPPAARNKAMATVVSVAGVGMAIGPVLGGLLLQLAVCFFD